MQIIDTYKQIEALCCSGGFDMDKWGEYICCLSPAVEKLCREDVAETLATGKFSFEDDYLPLLNAFCADAEGRKACHRSFLSCVDGLEDRIISRFGKCPDVDIVLYFGLCCAAGWVTEIEGRTSILLGMEKILELGWHEQKAMDALILHELGHAYQAQFGTLERETGNHREQFLWQLFTEGLAMYFEQRLCGDMEYFHQDADGWKAWCDEHLRQIIYDFDAGLDTMSFENQCWFGDWVKYQGRGDVGYYLGCRFVQFAAKIHSFDELINLDIPAVLRLWKSFIET